MKKLLVFCILIVSIIQIAHAHNPLSAMYYLEVKENIGILNISLSQSGFQEALKKQYSNIDLNLLSNTEYKTLAIKYLKENFDLNINGNQVKLLNGGLKLGNHETDIKFITSVLPKIFNTLDVKIDAFKENENHQTVFSVLINGETDKVILNKNNDYAVSVKFTQNKMITHTNGFNKNYLWFLVILPAYLVSKKYIN